MYAKLTYFCLFCSVACLALSCTPDTPDNEDFGKGAEMSFDVAALTRAYALTSFGGDRFVIYGDMKLSGNDVGGHIVLFNKTEVKKDGDSWSYEGTQYWYPKYEHSFIAVYPASPAGASDMTYSNSNLSFGYTLPEAFEDTPDLLVATHRRLYANDDFVKEDEDGNSPKETPVMLRFVHALSRVNFLVECEGAAAKIIVTKIRLDGINKSGTFTVSPAALESGSKQTDDYVLSWTDCQNNETLVADIEVEVADGSKQPLFPDNNALLVIPQPDNEGIIMTMTYTLVYKNGKREEKTLTAKTPKGGWMHGKVYTYSLTFNAVAEIIEMNVNVTDWKAGPVDNVQVPRK